MTKISLLKLFLIISGILIIAGSGYAGWITWKDIKEIEIPEIDTSDWKIYRNEKYGFEVKYPDAWQGISVNEFLFGKDPLWYEVHFSSPLTDLEVEKLAVKKKSNRLRLTITLNDNDSPEAVREILTKMALYPRRNAEIIEIKGNSGVKFKSRDESEIHIWLQRRKELYTINLIFSGIAVKEKAQKEKEELIFNQILESFKFIEPKDSQQETEREPSNE